MEMFTIVVVVGIKVQVQRNIRSSKDDFKAIIGEQGLFNYF